MSGDNNVSEARKEYYKLREKVKQCSGEYLIPEVENYVKELEILNEELQDKNQLLTDLNESINEKIQELIFALKESLCISESNLISMEKASDIYNKYK